jgi:hypothetical protein
MDQVLKGKSPAILIFAFAILTAAVAAIKLSPHRILWLLGLAASIPLFAAIIGGISGSREKDQS